MPSTPAITSPAPGRGGQVIWILLGVQAAAVTVFSQLPWRWQGWLALALAGGIMPAAPRRSRLRAIASPEDR